MELQIENGAKLTQSEKLAAKLLELKRDVTAKDRDEAMQELSIKSNSTISQYLNGKIRDNDTAADLISFFKKRIEARNLVLA